MHVTAEFVLAAILKCWLSANLYRLPPPFAEDSRGSSGIGRGKSIGLTEGSLLPAEAVDSNRSRRKYAIQIFYAHPYMAVQTSKLQFDTDVT